MFINCPHCQALVATDPASDLPPERCPRCAVQLRGAPDAGTDSDVAAAPQPSTPAASLDEPSPQASTADAEAATPIPSGSIAPAGARAPRRGLVGAIMRLLKPGKPVLFAQPADETASTDIPHASSMTDPEASEATAADNDPVTDPMPMAVSSPVPTTRTHLHAAIASLLAADKSIPPVGAGNAVAAAPATPGTSAGESPTDTEASGADGGWDGATAEASRMDPAAPAVVEAARMPSLEPAGDAEDEGSDAMPSAEDEAAAESPPAVTATPAGDPAVVHAPDTTGTSAVSLPAKPMPSFAHGGNIGARPGASWKIHATIAGLAVVLLLQLLLADRALLAADARWRPWLTTLCGALHCSLPPWREPSAFALLARDVRPHPSRNDALRVTATFRNDARWPQPWPRLRLTLSDIDGRPVAARDFSARDYLGSMPTQNQLASGQSATIAMDVREPAARSVAFDFELH